MKPTTLSLINVDDLLSETQSIDNDHRMKNKSNRSSGMILQSASSDCLYETSQYP